MNIAVDKDSEFTITLKDFIETLSQYDKFTLKIWVNGSEIPFKYDESADFYFMSEGIRIIHHATDSFGNVVEMIDYVLYDTIVNMRLVL